MSYVPRLCGRWSASRRFHCHHRLRPCSDHSRSFCASRLPSDTSRGSKDGLRLSLGGLLSDRFALFFLVIMQSKLKPCKPHMPFTCLFTMLPFLEVRNTAPVVPHALPISAFSHVPEKHRDKACFLCLVCRKRGCS